MFIEYFNSRENQGILFSILCDYLIKEHKINKNDIITLNIYNRLSGLMSNISERIDHNQLTNFRTKEEKVGYINKLVLRKSIDGFNTLIKDYLHQQLNEISPKFIRIIADINNLPGKILVYTQFRELEGVGLFTDFLNKKGYEEATLNKNNKLINDNINTFKRYMIFDLDKDKANEILELYYFTFTTLSTVGFGDFHPMSNTERLFMAFGMLFGVAIFSVIMGNFIDMLGVIEEFNEEFNEGEDLAKFFGILKAFNRGQFMKQEQKDKIEQYFDYRWMYHKNHFLNSDEYE